MNGMPDTGVPSTPPPRSHTSTQQWQSFEVRMRRRRVERCVLRAQVALDAGLVDEAETALAEARILDPSVPDLDALRALLLTRPLLDEAVAAQDTPDVSSGRRGGWKWAAAAAAAVVLGIGYGGLWRPGAPPAVASTAAAPAPVAQSAAPAAEPTPAVVRTPPAVAVHEVIVPVTESEVTAASRPAREEPPAPPVQRTAMTSAAATAPEPVVMARSEAAERPAVELASAPAPAVAAPPVAAPPVSPALANLAPVAPPPAPVSTPPPAPEATGTSGTASASTGTAGAAVPPRIDESARVRAVLSVYEAAYSKLDAAAARAVWPTVDQRALANAFSGLEAQRVSLERCDVAVTGPSARAECVGTASWTPKVGGGGRTAARRWVFDLRNASGNWQIVRAEAR